LAFIVNFLSNVNCSNDDDVPKTFSVTGIIDLEIYQKQAPQDDLTIPSIFVCFQLGFSEKEESPVVLCSYVGKVVEFSFKKNEGCSPASSCTGLR
jgi:hypothetical protein